MTTTHVAAERASGSAPLLRVGRAHDAAEHEAVAGSRALTGPASRAAGASAPGGTAAPPAVHAVLSRPGNPLPAGDLAWFEARTGADLSTVRVHTGGAADTAARSVDARAFTVGENVVLDSCEGASDAREVLAHELTHVLQARRSSGPPVLRRVPTPAQVQELRREMVRDAGRFLRALVDALRFDQLAAQHALLRAQGQPTPTLDEYDAVVSRFNQRTVQERLARGKGIYDAQNTQLGPDDPRLGELRATYAELVHEVKACFDAALAIAEHARRDPRDRERAAYGESMLLWVEASPFRSAALGTRSAFTAPEAAASLTYEADLGTVLARLTSLNLAEPGGPQRIIDAVTAARNRVVSGAGGTRTRAPLDPALDRQADEVVRAATGVRDMVGHCLRLLATTAAALELWAADPTQPSTAGVELQRLFATSDAAYGLLVATRLRAMHTQLAGTGRLYLHLHGAGGGDACRNPTVLGESPAPYEIVLCRPPRDLERDSLTLLHELAHAAVPGRGSRQPVQEGERPLDRAYPGERLLLRMSTEEALANAESYAELVFAVANPSVALQTPRVDTTVDCTPEQDSAVRDATARAQARTRRVSSWIPDWRQERREQGRYPDQARRVTATGFGAARDDAQIDVAFADLQLLQSSATVWHMGHEFRCAPAGAAGRALCPADAVATTSRWTISLDSVQRRARARQASVRALCAGFFAATPEDRIRVAFALVALAQADSDLSRPEDVLSYGRTAQAVWDIDLPAPVAAGLPDHAAADAAVP